MVFSLFGLQLGVIKEEGFEPGEAGLHVGLLLAEGLDLGLLGLDAFDGDGDEVAVVQAAGVDAVFFPGDDFGKDLADFSLLDHNNQQFGNRDLLGEWHLVSYGFTHCPDVCPTELFTLAEMMTKIEQNPAAVEAAPQVVFVSVDPQQDKPKSLQEYAGYYYKSFKGVTGQQEEVDKLTSAIGIFYERVYHLNGQVLVMQDDEIPTGLENSYLINHSATIVLINPEGDMHAVFSAPHDPAVMIRDLAAIQRAW